MIVCKGVRRRRFGRGRARGFGRGAGGCDDRADTHQLGCNAVGFVGAFGRRGGFWRNRLLGDGRRFIGLRAQHDVVVAYTGLDAALDFAFGNAVQHFGIRRRRFGAEIAVVRGQFPEILCNSLHRCKRVVKPLQRAGESAVGDRQDLTCTNHVYSPSSVPDFVRLLFNLRVIVDKNWLIEGYFSVHIVSVRRFRHQYRHGSHSPETQ